MEAKILLSCPFSVAFPSLGFSKHGLSYEHCFFCQLRQQNVACKLKAAILHYFSLVYLPSIFAFRYPDDPELTFDTLPTITLQEPDLYSDGKSGLDVIVLMKEAIEQLELVSQVTKFASEVIEIVADKCEVIPETVCLPVVMGMGGCLYLPFRAICQVVTSVLETIALIVQEAADKALWVLENALFIVRIAIFLDNISLLILTLPMANYSWTIIQAELVTEAEELDAPIASVKTHQNLVLL
jgi:hypothetical protein